MKITSGEIVYSGYCITCKTIIILEATQEKFKDSYDLTEVIKKMGWEISDDPECFGSKKLKCPSCKEGKQCQQMN